MKLNKVFFLILTFIAASQFIFSDEGNILNVKDLTIQVMPEQDFPSQWPKDTPSLLVGYYGSFVNNTNEDFSGDMEMELPLNYPHFKINMICDTERGMVCLPYNLHKKTNTVTWKLSRTLKPGEKMPFMLEYYSSPFIINESKSFNLTPVFGNDINKITVDISQPDRSTEFQVQPSPQESVTKDGTNHFFLYYNDLKAGNPIEMTISYIKTDNNPSFDENNKLNPGDFQSPPTSGSVGNSTFFIVVIISLAAVILGLVIFLGSKRREAKGRQYGKPAHPLKKRNSTVENEKSKIRKLLIDGKITEKTYKQLLKEISGNRS